MANKNKSKKQTNKPASKVKDKDKKPKTEQTEPKTTDVNDKGKSDVERPGSSASDTASTSQVGVEVPRSASGGKRSSKVYPLDPIDEDSAKKEELELEIKTKREKEQLELEIKTKRDKLKDLIDRHPSILDAPDSSGSSHASPGVSKLKQQYTLFCEDIWLPAFRRLQQEKDDDALNWKVLIHIIKASISLARDEYSKWNRQLFEILNDLPGSTNDNRPNKPASKGLPSSRISQQLQLVTKAYLASNAITVKVTEEMRETIYRQISNEKKNYPRFNSVWNNPTIKRFTEAAIQISFLLEIQPLKIIWNLVEGEKQRTFPSLSHNNKQIVESKSALTEEEDDQPAAKTALSKTVINLGAEDSVHTEHLQDKENGNVPNAKKDTVHDVNKTEWSGSEDTQEERQEHIADQTTKSNSRRKEKDNDEDHKRSAVVSEEARGKRKTVQELVKELEEIQIQLNAVTSRIAADMNAKVSADESSLENIAITNRPMNIASEYQTLCSQQWLDAKQELDEHHVSEGNACKMLCTVFFTAQLQAKESYKDMKQRLKQHINTILIYDEENIPEEIKIVTGDYLRHNASHIPIHPLVNNVLEKLKTTSKFPKGFTSFVTKKSMLLQYLTETSRLAWKMVLQRPQMKFSAGEMNEHSKTEPWSSKKDILELGWGSEPEQENAVIWYYIYPELHHGDKVMVKGKVFVHGPAYEEKADLAVDLADDLESLNDGPCCNCM